MVLTRYLIIVHLMITSITVDGAALGRIVSLKLKRKFWLSNYVLLNLDFVKISLDKGDLT
ncbi:MAG: hypothetical protein EWV55_08020 [Microcystis viridis Mv_BB_P_19951000_S69]|jgi:hypothetical protein|uniref:Uncharacterized protein n=2 Tax=Microcystis TaxID=1125 RepID=A0A552HNN5_MICVR|nr:hypothetical protein [Microcystis aeruginosa LG13-11]QGZ88358.1 hypothetical protein GQR42_00655 [Microcystis aeruginosa FD4]TRU72826.1 MAG: hypothetical protein EWV77_12840 [Microcystis viridis Mv_BB_P_19951000_S68D]TRU74135.1 MAG: hypothetical protein EWV47_11615 [Microcystis viridis Mv_BB_P_19951000_S68]TRU76073.1 MAG: hypothetical protein EWV55_08020 [Microcystis viridis Mv_BB_P_19951000_S69]TRU81543.1 MAG: hypothetical protein EWV46_20740 [Microcystis viridis Mv_BB_P_19951000_S69D]